MTGRARIYGRKSVGKETRNITEPEHFLARVHVTLWSRDEIELINIALAYDWGPGTSPERQEARINGVDIRFDASYRFTERISVPAGGSADVIIRREFITAKVITNDTDYRLVRL
ncbi:MAG: hypothetical protein ACLQDY_00590 [Streptosporangiaceae bacterium]